MYAIQYIILSSVVVWSSYPNFTYKFPRMLTVDRRPYQERFINASEFGKTQWHERSNTSNTDFKVFVLIGPGTFEENVTSDNSLAMQITHQNMSTMVLRYSWRIHNIEWLPEYAHLIALPLKVRYDNAIQSLGVIIGKHRNVWAEVIALGGRSVQIADAFTKIAQTITPTKFVLLDPFSIIYFTCVDIVMNNSIILNSTSVPIPRGVNTSIVNVISRNGSVMKKHEMVMYLWRKLHYTSNFLYNVNGGRHTGGIWNLMTLLKDGDYITAGMDDYYLGLEKEQVRQYTMYKDLYV